MSTQLAEAITVTGTHLDSGYVASLRHRISLRDLGLAVLAIIAASCSDSAPSPSGPGGGGGGGEPPSPMNVSNTVLVTGAASISAANSANGVRASVSFATADANVTYISLQPQTYPAGASATISNQRSGATLTTTMVDGGIDPVPLPAVAGDNVSIAVKSTDGLTVATLSSLVPSRRPPKIVRTVPGRGKTGVPLNKNIEVVFTEPVASNTLSSIRLFHGSTAVQGTATILPGVTAAVVFKPAANLTANTNYELVVPNSVHDLDGDALDSTVRVAFTTGTSIEGPVASLSFIPEGANIRIGDQFQASVVARDAGGNVITGHPVTWLTDTLHIVGVTSTGLVTGLREGLVAVLAEVDGVLGAMPVRVSNELHAVTSVVVAFDSGSVAPGGTLQVAAIAVDGEGNLQARRLVGWSTTNSAVATVAANQPTQSETNPAWFNGYGAPAPAIYWASVTGVANGVANIVVTIEGHSDTVAVTVGSSIPVVGLTLSRDTATVLLNDKVPFTGSSVNSAGGRAAIPATQIQWESSNPGVASVDANGVVAGVSAGSAIITGHWNSYSASTRVSVVQLTFESVSTGGTHTCALTTGGATYCWGRNDSGQSGQPGLFDLQLPGADYPKPVPAAAGLVFVAITAGEKHTCGLTAAGAAYCWGSNLNNALGSERVDPSSRPLAVSGGVTFASIAAGYEHTCGLTASGAAYCWGAGYSGQLGNGGAGASALPVPVLGGIEFTQLTAGRDHTCGLARDGSVYCWGGNWNSQLGVGANVPGASSPLRVSGLLTFASISAGEVHTCGVTRSGSLYCWGANYAAQLGTGDLRDSNVPVPVASNLTFTAVGGGFVHTCAIEAGGGNAYCWGVNDDSSLELGILSPGTYTTPQPVVGGLAFDRLTVQRSHTCARTTAGVWYCWGGNDSGELGVGTRKSGGTPLKVLGQQ